ncbi:MAG: SRPBCC family protein [Hyphomicrobiaceae bacterium]|nr:SRPBCC family protein [Hyphomicrobiaceae bacterium]
MRVDVENAIVINRPMAKVAAYAVDPDNAPEWYKNIRSVEWKSAPPLAVGSRLAFVAQFLGQRLAYTYEVTDFKSDLFVMRTAEGPFPMETRYAFRDLGGGHTEMVLGNRGDVSGFAALTAPLMIAQMNKANQADLRSIKAILESRVA